MDKIKILFGARIRSLRKQQGLTQQELGTRSQVGYKFIGGIERATENPTLEVIAKIAQGLEVELWELFQFEHETDDPDTLVARIDELIVEAEVADLQRTLKLLRAILR